ncbi:Phosphate-import permease protein PhnE [Corynebacterium urogenitale]|uniref:Phosphate-import permease protein PhnE n=1 Tax=Corynebacterium urogenitale TaxID=2487892 RepID=A0A5J6Z9B2_9CORY|nr:phosphonate ABC transporter, permease protein PhnE [Corynebacterium urogenitale]QFQ01889.1 Phosphate-import permease protein PhnE [Corynebacterium urogenitale]
MSTTLGTSQRPGGVHAPKRPAPSINSSLVAFVMALLAIAGAWSVSEIGINVATIVDSADNAVNFVQRMFPLDFPSAGELISMVAETFAIVFLATVLAVVISLPISVAAAQATARGTISRGAARTIIVLSRAIPDLVLAIFFLRVFGLGATAGILAMGLHSVGMVAKLYADAIEELDDGPREAVEAIGGTRRQQIVTAIPQALMPQIIATALHRFDINLRTSVLLGYVGVGGIGLAISESLRVLNYQRGMALALVVLLLCIVTELLSGSIRQMLLRNSSSSAPKTWVDRLWERRGAGESSPSTSDATRITPPWNLDRIRRFATGILIGVLILASIAKVDIEPGTVASGLGQLPESMALFFPPSDGGIAESIMEDILVTMQIALAATFLGAILAVPIGVLAARNVVPNPAVHNFFRIVIVVVRGIPELILAIIFVVVTGLGGIAGTLALALGAVGLLSKLIADSLEETDVRVQEAIRAAGATEAQVFLSATIRQAAPAFVAHIMYLLDTNFRSATLLGVVGAGGIGFQLLNAARVNQFDVVTHILILMLLVVLVIEALSMWMRKAIR